MRFTDLSNLGDCERSAALSCRDAGQRPRAWATPESTGLTMQLREARKQYRPVAPLRLQTVREPVTGRRR
jgi:hypothetical protein